MLHIKSIVKSIGDFTLGPMELTVGNEILVILGPSGSGKTTLLNVIAGILQRYGGQILMGEMDISEEPIENRSTAIVFQEDTLFPHMTVRENIMYANVEGENISKVIDIFGIEKILDRATDTLSGGEKNRVEVARAMASKPKILLLDEPLSSLDYPVRKKLSTDLRKILKRIGIPVIYVTHDRDIAWEMGDRIAIMSGGKICQIGTPKSVFKNPKTVVAAEITGESNIIKMVVGQNGKRGHIVEWGDYKLETQVDGLKSGREVQVCIRPEDIVLRKQGEGKNWVKGEVIEKIFKGHRYAVELNIEGVRDQIRAYVSLNGNEIVNLEDGIPVRVCFPEESIKIISNE